MTDLTNKTALVTGASRGVGRAAALALPPRGPASSSTTVAAPMRRNPSSRRSTPMAAGPMPLPPTSLPQTARTRSPRRCAVSSATFS